jgi:DNA-binding SARP family transcriptional activator
MSGDPRDPRDLRFTALRGPVGVLRNGRDLPIGGAKQRRLLAALLVDHDAVVSIDRLVDALWPGTDPPAGARRTVMSYASRLRSVIGADHVVNRAAGYVLSFDGASYDADDFEALLAEARRSDGIEALRCYDDAVALWSGRAFGDDGDEGWMRPAAARLDELHLVALGERADRLIALGRHREAVADLAALVAEHPLREPFVGSLMRALAGDGRRSEALRAARTFRSQLADETGLDPSRPFDELERHIASDDAATSPAWGQILPGYELGELIGQNSLGAVYRSTQADIGRDVAIGVIRPDLANDPHFIELFDAETRLVARIEHPHVVPLYDVHRRPGGAFLVFRFLSGGTLATRIATEPVSLDESVRIVDEIAGALGAAHRIGAVHRDLKPANIVFDELGASYLANFGIATLVGAAANVRMPPLDPPVHASPEQLLQGEVTPRSDQYSLASVMWEALVGRPPFAAATATATATAKLTRPVPPLGGPDVAGGPGVSGCADRLDEVFAVALAPEPTDRYPDLHEFVQAYRAAADPASPRIG